VVGLQLHRGVRSAPLGARTQIGRVAEQFGERHENTDRLLAAAVVDPFDAPAARRDVAHDLAHEVLGRDDLELHHGLEQYGLRAARGLLQRHRAGDLEGHLAGVDLVVRPVDERCPDVNERVPREDAGLHRFLDPVVDRGDVLARDLAAHDLVDELVATTLACGLEIDDHVRELTAATGLAGELQVHLVDVLADRLAVGDLWLSDVGIHLELA